MGRCCRHYDGNCKLDGGTVLTAKGQKSNRRGLTVVDGTEDVAKNSRRRFLRVFGVSSAGVAFAGAAAASKQKIRQGGEDARAEIEKLKQAYEELDKRSQLILRLVLVLSGLDIFF